MCSILKMTDRRVKWMEIWDLQSYVLCYVGYLSCLTLLSSVEVTRCTLKIPDVKIFKRLLLMLLSQFSFNFNENLEKACNPGKYRPLLFLFTNIGMENVFSNKIMCDLTAAENVLCGR